MMTSARILALAAPLLAATTLTTPAAAAQGFFWVEGYQGDIYADMPESGRVRPQVRPSVLPKGAAKAEKIAAEGRKPQGPLVVAISIQRQHMKVYDASGLFAESPISSGMPGHSTPMGVFSVIQKNKYHRSNIYSGAPMPYMQRITWSGIALHAGVLPGYPASHGCIRLPMSFAMKMWSWTRMGARVVVTPGEVSPVDLAHPTLAALVPPAPVAALPAMVPVKTADAGNSIVGGSQTVTDVATVASIVAADATTRLPNAPADDGMPALPAPAAVDLSDLDVPIGDALRPAADVAETSPQTSEAVGATATIAPPVIAPVEVAAPMQVEPGKDQSQIATTPLAPEPVVAAPLIKRNQAVAIFVSRKDAKIYVRQNFTPVFDMPIDIAAADKALGTHVFTARPSKDEDGKLQWSVVSLPAVARQAGVTNDERRRRRNAAAAVVAPIATDTPEEALARLAIPAELMSRIGETLPTGSSLVVSDQGIAQGETGAGTDFIVRLR